jgi:hypothetical protein
MELGRPDTSELLAASGVAARSMGQPEADDVATRAFLEKILYSEDSRDLWSAFVQGLITSEELRNAILAYFATWLSHTNATQEPSAEIWCTAEVEQAFDSALFKQPNVASRAALHAPLVDAIRDASARSHPSAVLLLEATESSVALMQRRESGAAVHDRLLSGFLIAIRTLAAPCVARISWRGCEFLLTGSREELTQLATRLLQRLLAWRHGGSLEWRLVLTKVFVGEPDRTLRCDPGYDLASVPNSFVAWVEPYSGADWREPQRYPSTEIVFSASKNH